jgi:hypothetical protein
MVELAISIVCLTTLIVVLLEIQAEGGSRRLWPFYLWMVSLALLGCHVLVRVYQNLDQWSPERIFMGLLSAANFFVAVLLLVRGVLLPVLTGRSGVSGGSRGEPRGGGPRRL